eukprot:289063_1
MHEQRRINAKKKRRRETTTPTNYKPNNEIDATDEEHDDHKSTENNDDDDDMAMPDPVGVQNTAAYAATATRVEYDTNATDPNTTFDSILSRPRQAVYTEANINHGKQKRM